MWGDLLARTEMAEIPNVQLNVSSQAENVLLVRQALNGLAETIHLDPLELNDISTAVSEACNNVALHAYDSADGPLELEIYVGPALLTVVVRDHGVGIHPRIDDESGGIGLPIMLALAQSVEFHDLDGDGTEVRLEFAITARAAELERALPGAPALAPVNRDGIADDVTVLTLAPAKLGRTVLPRLLSALAARAFFSTDRISDAQLLADALVAHSEETVNGGQLNIDINVRPRALELRLGPLQTGRTSELVGDGASGGLGLLLARLAESHEVRSAATGDVLALRLTDNGA